MNASVSDFLHKLRKFVQDESKAHMNTFGQQRSHPLNERVARGWTIEGLHVDPFKNEIAHLICTTNKSFFCGGDLVVLHCNGKADNLWQKLL